MFYSAGNKLLSQLHYLEWLRTKTVFYSADSQKTQRFTHVQNTSMFISILFVQTVSSGHVNIHYLPTANMIADVFTKSLARIKFERFRELYGSERSVPYEVTLKAVDDLYKQVFFERNQQLHGVSWPSSHITGKSL